MSGLQAARCRWRCPCRFVAPDTVNIDLALIVTTPPDAHPKVRRGGLIQVGHAAGPSDHSHLPQRRDARLRIRPVAMIEGIRRTEFPAKLDPLVVGVFGCLAALPVADIAR